MSAQETTFATCHYWRGDGNSLAVVLSCPGREEMEQGFPAASTIANSTGANLNRLLEILATRLNRPEITRNNVTITNAWPYVEFQNQTGRTEAKISEIKQQWNIDRLFHQLSGIKEVVIACGVRAQVVCRRLNGLDAKIIEIPHLGARGLNTIELKTNKQSKSDNNTKRLEILAERIAVVIEKIRHS